MIVGAIGGGIAAATLLLLSLIVVLSVVAIVWCNKKCKMPRTRDKPRSHYHVYEEPKLTRFSALNALFELKSNEANGFATRDHQIQTEGNVAYGVVKPHSLQSQ